MPFRTFLDHEPADRRRSRGRRVSDGSITICGVVLRASEAVISYCGSAANDLLFAVRRSRLARRRALAAHFRANFRAKTTEARSFLRQFAQTVKQTPKLAKSRLSGLFLAAGLCAKTITSPHKCPEMSGASSVI